MKRLRKALTITVMMVTVLSMSMVAVPLQANAAAQAGDLIKMSGLSSVYYLGGDGKRYVFPNEQTYFSWYSDFSSVVTIPQSELETYPLGANVTIRPGTKLVKITTDPKVYAVESDGILKHVPSEATAIALYGANWAKRVVDVSDAFFTNYTVSTGTVSATAYPEGSLIKAADASDVYYIASDGTARKIASEAAFTANRFKWSDIITTTLAIPTLGTAIAASESALIDTSSGAGGVAGAGTGLTVALASDTPASASIPASATANQSATNVTYAKFNFTAANDGAVTINSLTVKRTGVGSAGDFSYVYLYEGSNRLTSGKTVNTSSNLAVFTGLNYTVPAGATKTLTLVADIGINVSGNDAFQIEAAGSVVTDGAAVSGSFPITGNTMSLASVTGGKLTVTAGADPSAPSVGALAVNMAQFKLAAANEDIKVSRIALYQSGTISNTNLSNFKLYEGSTVLASVAAISSKNLVSLALDTPYLITKGTTKTFDVKGDIGGSAKNGDTVVFYIENAADVYGVGQTYGFGTGVDFTGYDNTVANTEASNCTVSGGQLTISSSGPSASNVRGTNVDFMDFSIAAGVNTEIKSLRLELYYGGIITGATSTSGYITNVRIVDTDSNAVVGGPIDLGNTSSWTSIGSTGSYHDFTDTITIAAGKSRNFKVLADLNNSLSAGPLNVVLGSTASAYTLSTTAGAKNTDNNQWISNIVPSTYITGKTMTFTTSALTVSAATSPATQTASQGDTVSALGIVLAPGTSQTARVTSVKVAGYISGSTNNFTLYELGADKITDTVESITLWDGSTQVGATKSFGTDGYATFDNLNVSVPSSGKTLVVKAKISTNATTTGQFAIEIVANATDVAAYDQDNNSITPVVGTVNADEAVHINMSTGGTVTAALNSDYPSAIVAAGTSANALSFKFYGTNQAMKITKMRLAEVGTNNIQSLTLTYAKDAAGTTESKTTTFVGANADFTDLNIYIPKTDWSRNVIASLAISAVGSGSTSGDAVSLTIDYDTNFEAVAADGGTTKVTSLANGADITGATNHTMIIRKSVPTFVNTVSVGGSAKYGASLVSTFKVAATAGSVSVKKVKLTTSLTDGQYGTGYTDFTVTDLKVYRNGTQLTELTDYRIYKDATATTTATTQLHPAGTGSLATTTTAFYIVFDGGTVVGGEEVITAGMENTYDIVGTFAGYETARDSITTSISAFGGSATLNDNLISTGQGNYYLIVTGGTNTEDNVIWSDNSDGASHSSVVDAAAPTDWINGYKVTVN